MDANSLGFTLRPQRLRKARCFVNAGNRIIRASMTPIALVGFAAIYAKYQHVHIPIEIIDLICVFIILPMTILLFAVSLLNQAFDLKFILCPRCSKPVFDKRISKEPYPQHCCHCGLDIGSCKP